jgi:ribosomal protein S18 acetylase RimI-like enzyme
VKGLAQFIFSEFCARCWSGRPLVNAGDDWGIESLAWTKQSYRPVRRLNKYVLRREATVQVAVDPVAAPAEAAPMETPAVTTPIVIRPATDADVIVAEHLEQTCFDTYSLTRRQLRYLRKSPNCVFLVAEQGGEVVGDAIALVRHHRPGTTGRLYSLAVRSDCRGRKIGHQLLSAVLSALRARGVRRVTLEVESTNQSAIRLYHRYGFRDAALLPDYYGADRSGTRMVCELTSEKRIAA